MDSYKKYDNTTVRIRHISGDVLTGPCEWDDAEYNLSEWGREEESLRIGDYIIYGSDIVEIELLRPEAVIPVRDWPEAKEEIALWFHERWHIPLEAYRESIRDCLGLGERSGIPQWYVVVRGNRIIAGCGVIENDFHERKDLTPNVCAVYVDEEYRRQGIAGFMLQTVCDDMAAMGCKTLYLLTSHVGFYERYGWRYLCDARGDDGGTCRVYVHQSGKREPVTVFESDNIRFVEVSEDLVPDYLALVNDQENVNRYIGGSIGGSSGPYTADKEVRWIRKKLTERAPVFSMIEKSTGEYIGNIEFMDADGAQGELGIAITARKQDRGFGTEAVTAFVKYGLERMRLRRIWLRTRPFNGRARHVYEKCGFREYDRTEDHIFMEYDPEHK